MTFPKIVSQHKFNRTVVFFILLLTATSFVSAQTAKKVEELVDFVSGGKLRVETRATPYQLIGDFDGDKIEDVAVVVSLSDTAADIAKSVRIEYPYYFKKEVDPEILALMIVHGKGKGWQFAQKSSVLFLGRNSVLLFQKSRLDEIGDGMELVKDKRGRVGIYFTTEGADGTLKWNGRRYVWTESQP